jgi:hypothetical protein
MLSSCNMMTKLMKKPVSYMSQILSDEDFKYSYIEKHVFSLVKVV